MPLQPTSHASGIGGVLLQNVIPRREKAWMFYPGLLQLNLLLLGAIIGDVTNGYDQTMLNGLQILDPWQNYFGAPTGGHLGLIVNGVRIGAVGALFVTAPLIQHLGRRWPIIIGSLIMLVGTALQAAAQSTPMFIVGRVLLGFGNTIQVSTCPILLSELAYPSERAQITAILNITGSLGQILAAWITFGTQYLGASNWSWRLPSLLQAVPSLLQIILVLLMPESPRWLIMQNREAEAQKILTKYHAENDESSELVKFEMAEIRYTLLAERASAKPSWLEWIRTPANRRRLLIVVSLAFLIQWCGNAVLSYYLKLVLESVGITSSSTQAVINGCVTINNFLWGVFFSFFVERLGRRSMFLGGMAGMFVAFLLLTVLTGVNSASDFTNPRLSGAAVGMIFLFGVFYKMAGPVQDPYFMEIAPYHLRPKTAVIKAFGDTGANLFSGFVNPIALQAIGWKYYIVWCVVLVSNFVTIYLFYPETKGLSLEEVAQVFDGNEIPATAVEDDNRLQSRSGGRDLKSKTMVQQKEL